MATRPLLPHDWHHGPDMPHGGSGGLERRLRISLDILVQGGIRVPSNCRAKNALRLLHRINSRELRLTRRSKELQGLVRNAHRTAWETFLIVYATTHTNERNSPFARQRLADFLRGHDIESLDRSAARNYQFELYVAALPTLGGCTVKDGEPDLRLRYGYEDVGIAVKRISSLKDKQLQVNIEDGIGQIDSNRPPGFLALNIDSRFSDLLLPLGYRARVLAFQALFDSLNRHLAKHKDNRNLLGCIVSGYLSRWRFPKVGPPRLDHASPLRWLGIDDDPGRALLFKRCTESWRTALTNSFEAIAGR